MKFHIKRASRYSDDRDFPPCEEAEWHEEWERRTHMGQYWMTSGKDHGESEEEGRFGTYLNQWWTVDIPDLPALIAFIQKYGEIIVNDERIIIYDDYVE